MIAGDADNDEGRGQEERRDGVRQTVREGRIEDGRCPLGRKIAPVFHPIAGRGLHPTVHRQNPEGREKRPRRDQDGRAAVHDRRHQLAAEQQDAEESGLQEEGGQTFVGQ